MQTTYLNTAASGLVPTEFTVAANRLYAELAVTASTRAEKWRDEEQPAIRQNVATFLGVPDGNVALIPNFSWAMNGIVHSLRGDEKILLYTADYPSLLEPFRINGFDMTWISDTDGFTISAEELKAKLLSEKIEILAISHVQWMSGYKINLADLGSFCKEHDIWFIVDATQSMGAMPINPAKVNIDVFIASNYKWMNAGFGTGVMYVNDEFLKEYTPALGGNNSYQFKDGKPQYTPGILSFEPGHPNMFGFTILNAAITHKMQLGLPAIEAYNKKLTQLLLDEIQSLNVQLIGESSTSNRASIVFLKDQNGLGELLKSNGIIVTHRMGLIRISIHYYSTEADVMTLVKLLKGV